MDILVVSAEIAPYSRWTSTGEACAALPKALRGLGHKVTVLSPLWASIDPGARHLARRLVRFPIEVDGATTQLSLFDGRSPGGVDLAFLANESLFPAGAAATDLGPETAARWGAFVRGATEWIKRRETPPDVVHCFGWQTAVLPTLLRADPALASIPTVLTIDGAKQHGLYERSALSAFALPDRLWRIDGVEFYGKLSPLKAGLQSAARITTPSPSHAREILEDSGGLEGVLRSRGKALTGVLDGVDVSVWNSATDPWLEARFDAMDVAGAGRFGKHRCKSAAQKELGFAVRDDVALISATDRVAADTGFERLAEILPSILRNDVQLAIAAEPGSDEALVARFVSLAERFPDRLAVRSPSDASIHHRLLGASDLVIAPGLHDPSGSRVMQAHRYGALPIALRRHGAADAVVDCDAQLASGTGFLYDEPAADALLGAIQRALAAWVLGPAFRRVQHRVMTIDHSWDRSARIYERIYRSAATRLATIEGDATASEART